MVELEVQILAHEREGLLMDMGRLMAASGFSLHRQRLVQDPHGALLTMLVRGPARGRRVLDAALEGHERVIAFVIESGDGEAMRPHFALTQRVDRSDYVPPPAPPPLPPAPSAPARPKLAVPAFGASVEPSTIAFLEAVPPIPRVEPRPQVASPPQSAPPSPPVQSLPLSEPPAPPPKPEPLWMAEPDFLLPQPPPPPAPAPAPLDPYVEIAPLPPDVAAVARLLAEVDELYPRRLVPALLELDRTVAPGAREPTLQLAGKRIGAWLATRQADAAAAGSLDDAIAKAGLPALSDLVTAEVQGSQLHLHESPLCAEPGHSGCAFFSGLLQGVLTPALPSHEVSLFNICCRAWGADECVLAVSE